MSSYGRFSPPTRLYSVEVVKRQAMFQSIQPHRSMKRVQLFRTSSNTRTVSSSSSSSCQRVFVFSHFATTQCILFVEDMVLCLFLLFTYTIDKTKRLTFVSWAIFFAIFTCISCVRVMSSSSVAFGGVDVGGACCWWWKNVEEEPLAWCAFLVNIFVLAMVESL